MALMASTNPSGSGGMPIAVVAYDTAWPERFASASTEILTAVGSRFLRLEHIGSTSVPGLAAKPVIDMMASVQRLQDGLAARAVLAGLGYELVDTGMPDRLFLSHGMSRLALRREPDAGWRVPVCRMLGGTTPRTPVRAGRRRRRSGPGR